MPESSLKQRIQEDIKTAMRSRDTKRLNVIRYLASVIKQEEIDKRIAISDAQIFAIIEKLIKQRLETIEQSKSAGRSDIIEKEEFELAILKSYLPEPLADEELEKLITDALLEAKATTMKDMGKVMSILKPKIQGRADIAKISEKIKAQLTAG